MNRIPITPEGYKMLVERLGQLRTEKPKIITAIAEARANGDLSENADYAAAKDRQGLVEAMISDLELKVSAAEIIETNGLQLEKVQFGAYVMLFDSRIKKNIEYRLVGEYEASLPNEVSEGTVSVSSPLGRALLGRKKGDEVEVITPNGIRYYDILSIKY